MFRDNNILRRQYSVMLLVATVSILSVGIVYAALSSGMTPIKSKIYLCQIYIILQDIFFIKPLINNAG